MFRQNLITSEILLKKGEIERQSDKEKYVDYMVRHLLQGVSNEIEKLYKTDILFKEVDEETEKMRIQLYVHNSWELESLIFEERMKAINEYVAMEKQLTNNKEELSKKEGF